LYAVYYKKLNATKKADAAQPTDQEFIWNDAIWRVVNTKEMGKNRLVIKFSALTEDEVTGLGFNVETAGYYVEHSEDNALRINYQLQTSKIAFDGEKYFFDGPDDDGYSRSRVKAIIDAYYNQKLTNYTAAVQPVALNTPTWKTYTGPGFEGNAYENHNEDGDVDVYFDWDFSTIDEEDYGKFYQDARFETTVGSGKKQAFALNYGDIHGAIGVPKTLSDHYVTLLDFSGTNLNSFWLRSPGSNTSAAGNVLDGDIRNDYLTYTYSTDVYETLSVRPALYLSVD
ncbi:hypothetical protein, partial [Pseudolactococcus yaeyamensis]